MSKLNLKDNIWIEGFTREELFDLSKEDWRNIVDDVSVDKMLYSGKTSEIPEEIAKMVLDWMFWDEKIEQRMYKNYNKPFIVTYPFVNYKESIQSACNKEYCIIYKTN